MQSRWHLAGKSGQNTKLLIARTVAALALFVLASEVLYVQEYNFRTLGAAEGLNNLAVQKIYQDGVGFIWVSTENGIFRYDGERFQAFGPQQGISSSSGAAFGDDPDGSLSVGGDFRLYKLSGNRFERLPGNLGTVSWAQGIQSDGKGDTFSGLPDRVLLAIQKDLDGNLGVRARNASVFMLPAGCAKFRRPDAPIPGSAMGHVASDADGRLLITSHDGLLIRDEKGWQKIETGPSACAESSTPLSKTDSARCGLG
jgi:ligand-binding sensor domain-containing protein